MAETASASCRATCRLALGQNFPGPEAGRLASYCPTSAASRSCYRSTGKKPDPLLLETAGTSVQSNVKGWSVFQLALSPADFQHTRRFVKLKHKERVASSSLGTKSSAEGDRYDFSGNLKASEQLC